MLEAIKNSSVVLSDVIAVVSDAGILSYPENTSYSVMPLVNNSISLRDWISHRDKLLTFCEEYLDEPPLKSGSIYSVLIVQSSLNLIIGLLNSYSKFVQHGIIHGDLNPNNILVRDSLYNVDLQHNLEVYFKCSKVERISLKQFDYPISGILNCLHPFRSMVSPGKISSSIYDVQFIDLGTSQLETTNR